MDAGRILLLLGESRRTIHCANGRKRNGMSPLRFAGFGPLQDRAASAASGNVNGVLVQAGRYCASCLRLGPPLHNFRSGVRVFATVCGAVPRTVLYAVHVPPARNAGSAAASHARREAAYCREAAGTGPSTIDHGDRYPQPSRQRQAVRAASEFSAKADQLVVPSAPTGCRQATFGRLAPH